MQPKAMNQVPVVDCDCHVMEPADLWQTYLEPKYRPRAIRIEETDNVERLIINDQVILEGRLAGLGGVERDRVDVYSGKLKYKDGCPEASYDAAARARMFESWQVDIGVALPTISILPFPPDDLELANAYCRAYNNWQNDFRNDLPEQTVSIAILNWHDVDAAAAELDRCLKMGFGGVFAPPDVIDDRRPGNSHFDPIWQRCEAADIPAVLHVVVRFQGGAVPYAAWSATSPGAVFTFGLSATGQLQPALASMILDGLFERFPRLKIINVEAGCGWAAHFMDRLDEKYQWFGPISPAPLKMKPSDYVRQNCYFVAEPEERTIGAMLELVGDDRILWGSDFPHVDANIEAPNLIRSAIAGLSTEQQVAVLGGNAAKVYNLN